jgi:predicted ferric reductase/Ca2+-binding EF-hand superfamily protein
MQSPSRPSAVDARLLEALERAFAEHSAGGQSIDVKRLQAAIGLRSEYLARRVLSVFDTNGDGVVDRAEFLAAAKSVICGTDREKLFFAFRIHDHDGDGSISETEMFRMIAVSLAESDVAEKASQPPERLAHVLFLAADENRDGKITFDEFESTVRKRPALLKKMVRSEALWIAPNEDLLAWIEGGRPKRRGRVARLFENRWQQVLWLALWAATNVGIFAFIMIGGGTGPWQDQTMLLGRASGFCMDFNGALILVPVMRRLLTRVRASVFGRVLPVDEAITFHRIVGHTLFALALGHSALFVLSYVNGHPTSGVGQLFTGTERGATGVLLLVVFAVMWVFSLGIVRRSSRFELFYFTHLLYVAWLALVIAHAPSFLFGAAIPLLGFVAEQGLRLARRGKATAVISSEALRSGVTRLEIRKPPNFDYDAADYIFLRLPEIARGEWHPFTVSNAPENATMTVHARTLGNWTRALRRTAEERESEGRTEPMTAYVDGPYGSPSAHIFESRHAVFIGAGIGVTPFASVLESVVLRANGVGSRPSKLERVYFFWLNQDQYSFEWFRALLAELEKTDDRTLLDIHLCMTGARSGATAMGLEMAREVLHAAGRSDLITGLRTHTHLGHPDFESMLGEIAQKHAPELVDVFFCGPPGLAKKLRRICEHLRMPFREERF